MSKDRHQAFVGLGSNIEPKASYIERAINAMNDHESIDVVDVSTVYRTTPVGGPEGQEDYLNAVAKIVTTLEPEPLLDALQTIESDLGRKREVKWGPRTIDLDILLYNERIISTDRLAIPHPFMHDRRFVMQGLAEIAPNAYHPMLQMTAQTILESLGDEDGDA